MIQAQDPNQNAETNDQFQSSGTIHLETASYQVIYSFIYKITR